MNKKNIFTIIISIIALFLIYLCDKVSTVGNIFNDININNYEATLTFNESGDVEIIEKYHYVYKGDYQAKYRDIETNKYNENNPIAQSYKDTARLVINDDITTMINVYINDEKLPTKNIDEDRMLYKRGYAYVGITGQRDELGQKIACEVNSNTCNSLFVYVKDGFTRNTVFEYKYTIKGAITSYNDIASFNWKLFEYNEANIKSGKVTLNFPSNSKKDDLRCFARGAKKYGNIEIVNDKQILLTFKDINNDDALEIRALSNNNLYPLISSYNKVNVNALNDILEFEDKQAKLDNKRISIANTLFYGSFGLIALMVIVTIFVYFKFDKEHKVEFDQEYLRELPDESLTPAEMSYLYYFGTINDEDVTATLLDLIRRKYLTIEYDSNVTDKDLNYTIRYVKQDNSKLKAHEIHLIEWFCYQIGKHGCVTSKQIEEYTEHESKARKFISDSKMFVSLAKNEGKKHDFIIDNRKKSTAFGFIIIPVIYLFITLFMSMIHSLDVLFALLVSIACIVIYTTYVITIKKRTQYGANEFAKWKAFKNFLNDFSEMKDYPLPSIVVWEHYLVYATSLKMADTVMKQLQVKLPEFNEENVTSNTYYSDSTFFMFGYYRGYRRARLFYSLSSSFKNAKVKGMKTIAAANAKKVSSGRGGGFSGGSSFGGGGGGGRSR